MKTRRIHLGYDSSSLSLEVTGGERTKLTVRGNTDKGGRYEVVVVFGDVELGVLARAIRGHFKEMREAEQRHAAWREEPFKP